MKSLLLTFLIILKVSIAICQDTKLITIKHHREITEKYYVLKSDRKIKHGEYISFYPRLYPTYESMKSELIIKEKGCFKLGKKDSSWVEYESPSSSNSGKGTQTSYGKRKTAGYYKENKKVGIWSMYKNDFVEKYDYDHNKKLQPYIPIKIRYPKSAQDTKLEGKVIASFQTHKDCSISDITITQSLSPDCDKATIDAVKKMAELLKEHGIDCEEKTETQTFNFTLQ